MFSCCDCGSQNDPNKYGIVYNKDKKPKVVLEISNSEKFSEFSEVTKSFIEKMYPNAVFSVLKNQSKTDRFIVKVDGHCIHDGRDAESLPKLDEAFAKLAKKFVEK